MIGEDYTLSFGELTASRPRCSPTNCRPSSTPADQLVAIVMEKGFEQIVAALAVLETGRAFLPISAGQPDQRIQTILRQAGARVALTQPRLHRGRAGTSGSVLLEVTPEPITGAAPPRLPQTATPDDPAYVIYTSGSTGVPKGVTIQHRAARNTLADLTERFAFTCCRPRAVGLVARVRSLDLRSLRHPRRRRRGRRFRRRTASRTPRLGRGGPPPWGDDLELRARARRAHALGRWQQRRRAARQSAPDDAQRRLDPGRAGRAASAKQIPACRLYSLGGATEASIWSIFHPIEQVDPQWVSIPYGKPLRNQSFHVLKNDLAPCPIHTTGKLFIGGAGLAAGLLERSGTDRGALHSPPADRRARSTTPETWAATGPTARSSSWAAKTSR